MLSRLYRLSRAKDIQATLRQGRCAHLPPIKICFRRTNNAQPRITCIVGRHVDRSSVVRHRYQRYLREIARDLISEHPNLSCDIVLIAQPLIRDYQTKNQIKTEVWGEINQLLPH